MCKYNFTKSRDSTNQNKNEYLRIEIDFQFMRKPNDFLGGSYLPIKKVLIYIYKY